MNNIWYRQMKLKKERMAKSRGVAAGSKYGAKKTADGFPSKLERAVYEMLLLREKKGEVKDVRRQHRVDLVAGVSWKIDFSATDTKTGKTIFVEAKGIETSDYKIKKKLFKEFGTGLLEIWKGNYHKPKLAEVITPASLREPSLGASLETVPLRKPRKSKSQSLKKQTDDQSIDKQSA